MDGRQFLNVARRLVQEQDEESWRTAAGRAYYALFLEARAALIRWGVTGIPQFQAHAFVRNRFDYAANFSLKQIGKALEQLGRLRDRADYEIDVTGPFHSYFSTEQAIFKAEGMIDLLDDIEADPAELAAAVAAVLAVP